MIGCRRMVHQLLPKTKVVYSNKRFHFIRKSNLCFSLDSANLVRFFYWCKNEIPPNEKRRDLWNQMWGPFLIANTRSTQVVVDMLIYNGRFTLGVEKYVKNCKGLTFKTGNRIEIDDYDIDWILSSFKSFYLKCIRYSSICLK